MVHINDPDGNLDGKIDENVWHETGFGRYSITRISSGCYLASIINYECLVSKVVSENGCSIISGTMYSKNSFVATISGSDSVYLKNLTEGLKDQGLGVEKIASYVPRQTPSMTPKQENAVRLALENGYYEIPRKISIDELSRLSGASRSSFDVTLRTAEKKIISTYFQNYVKNFIMEKK